MLFGLWGVPCRLTYVSAACQQYLPCSAFRPAMTITGRCSFGLIALVCCIAGEMPNISSVLFTPNSKPLALLAGSALMFAAPQPDKPHWECC